MVLEWPNDDEKMGKDSNIEADVKMYKSSNIVAGSKYHLWDKEVKLGKKFEW